MLTAIIAAVTAASLTIDYRFTHDGQGELYVFHLLSHVDRSGTRTPDPQLAYVALTSPSEAVVGKFLVPVPAGMKAEAPEIPALLRLRPGQAVEGRVVVPVPLTTAMPYLQPPADAGPQGRITRIRFRIGVLEQPRFPPGALVVEPAGELFTCDYGFGLQVQRLFEVVLDVQAPGLPARLP